MCGIFYIGNNCITFQHIIKSYHNIHTILRHTILNFTLNSSNSYIIISKNICEEDKDKDWNCGNRKKGSQTERRKPQKSRRFCTMRRDRNSTREKSSASRKRSGTRARKDPSLGTMAVRVSSLKATC